MVLKTKEPKTLSEKERDFVKQAIERQGTPTYVHFAERLLENYREIRGAFGNYSVEVRAAAFPLGSDPVGLRSLQKEGSKLMVTSVASMEMAIRTGFKSEDLSYVASGISEKDMQLIVQRGVFVYLDSKDQLTTYARITQKLEVTGTSCGIRLRLDVDPPNQKEVHASAVGKNSRLGITDKDLPQALYLAKKNGLEVTELHIYVGSNVMEHESLSRIFETFAGLIVKTKDLLPDLKVVNAGGGFGVDYTGKTAFDIKSYADRVTSTMESLSSIFGRALTLAIEPGRKLYADTAVFVARVTGLNHMEANGEEVLVINVDASCAMMPRYWLYGTEHRTISLVEGPEVKRPVKLSGQTTFSLDVLTSNLKDRSFYISEVNEGDVLVVLDCGAYQDAMRSEFLQQLKPAVVWVLEDGTLVVSRRRESVEEHMNHLWNWGAVGSV